MSDHRVPYVLMRGGTSKGVFLHAHDIHTSGEELDALLLGIMGSPDPMQIDGLGGTYSSTSKAVIVHERDNVVYYRFAQVGVSEAVVDWSGNCGNLTTAVAPFAIDEGLIDVAPGLARVALHNVNTGVSIEAELATDGRRALVDGDHAIAGVPGAASPITTRYLDPAPKGPFPTGHAREYLQTSRGPVECSIVAVTHPYVIIGLNLLHGRITPTQAHDNEMLAYVEEIRVAAAKQMMANGYGDLTYAGPAWPRIVAIGSATGEADLQALAFSMGVAHRALPMTAALCLAAVSQLPGTVGPSLVAEQRTTVRIEHPKGRVEVEVVMRSPFEIASVGVVRTARRIADGEVYVTRRLARKEEYWWPRHDECS